MRNLGCAFLFVFGAFDLNVFGEKVVVAERQNGLNFVVGSDGEYVGIKVFNHAGEVLKTVSAAIYPESQAHAFKFGNGRFCRKIAVNDFSHSSIVAENAAGYAAAVKNCIKIAV